MTITKRFRRRIRRYALMCVMAATTAGMVESTRPTMAGDYSGVTHDSLSCFQEDLCGWVEELSSTQFGPDSQLGPDSLVVADNKKQSATEPFFNVRLDDHLAIDTCSYDDWLAQQFGVVEKASSEIDESVATAKYLGKHDQASTANHASRTSAGFNATLAAIAASATAGNPISFGYWSEPFAMVGPTAGHVVEEIETFQAWFQQSINASENPAFVGEATESESLFAEIIPFVPIVDFDGMLEGVSSMMSEIETTSLADISSVDPNELLVGSSPIIATLEESYFAYDLTDQDLASIAAAESDDELTIESTASSDLWGAVFDRQDQPFCIRSLAVLREPGWSPLAKNVPTVSASPEPIAESMTVAAAPAESTLVGSATCLLDEWVWYVGNALEDHGVTDKWLQPETIGENVALLVVSSETLAERAATQLALVWPVEPKPAIVVPGDGARLLARAEAAPAADATLEDAELLVSKRSAESVNDQQLAQATATVMQWVDAAQSVIDDVSNHLDDVIEVARNRGTQDDSTRRE